MANLARRDPDRAPRGARPRRSAARMILSSLSLVFAVAALAAYGAEARRAAGAKRFARRFSLELRRPADLELLSVQPAADLAGALLVEAALRDASEELPPEDLSPEQRRAWAQASRDLEQELAAARGLMIDALAFRPGSASHRLHLGQVAYAMANRLPKTSQRAELWDVPLRLAAEAAPGLGSAWVLLGEAYLEGWGALPPAMRGRARRIFEGAFEEDLFVSRSFVRAARLLGRDEAIRLLPERSEILRDAARALSWEGDLAGAARAFSRMDGALRRERAEDLRAIETRRRLGDVEGLRTACLEWARNHPVGDFDDEIGRAEEARVLALWPADPPGSWWRDPRADRIRFFLNGRESSVPAETLARALGSLSGVPVPVAARVRLLAGDPSGAERLRRASEGEGLDWTAYLLARAKFELARGRLQQARNILARVTPDAREECDALLARRAVARALSDALELDAVEHRLAGLRISGGRDGGWSAEQGVSFCLDPERTRGRELVVEIEADSPSIVSYGWEGARSGTVLAETRAGVRFPLERLSGQRTLAVHSLAGGSRGRWRASLAPAASRSKVLGSTP